MNAIEQYSGAVISAVKGGARTTADISKAVKVQLHTARQVANDLFKRGVLTRTRKQTKDMTDPYNQASRKWIYRLAK